MIVQNEEMKILKSTTIENPRWVLMDVYCPKCFHREDCGIVDGGEVSDGDLVEFHHEECGHSWVVLVSVTELPENIP
jgi:hypothetical protein